MLGKKVITQSAIYGLASVITNGSNFFLIPFYTHYLSTSEYGIISSVLLFSTIVTAFFTFGLNSAITRFYFDFNENTFKDFLFTTFIFQIVTAVSVTAVIIACNGLFLDRLFRNVPYDPFLKNGIFIGLFAVFGTIPLALLQAESKAILYRALTTLSFVILTILMIVFIAVFKQGSMGGIKASLIANTIMAMIYAFFIIRKSSARFRFDYIKMSLIFSLPIMVYALFGVITEISSKFFIERFMSLSELGIFNVAQQLSSLIVLLTNALNMAWIPIFYAEAKKNEKSVLFSNYGTLLIFFLTIIGLAICLFSKEFVHLFMSPDYVTVSVYIPFLILAYIIGSGYWVLIINPLTFSKKTFFLPMLTILSGIVSVGLNLVLIPRFGAVGAALSTCMSYIILVCVAYLIYKRHSAVRYDFRRMNSILFLGIIIVVISQIVPLNGFVLPVVFKSILFFLFIGLLAVLRIYSLKNIKLFISSQLN